MPTTLATLGLELALLLGFLESPDVVLLWVSLLPCRAPLHCLLLRKTFPDME